jgi:hypothetical protein
MVVYLVGKLFKEAQDQSGEGSLNTVLWWWSTWWAKTAPEAQDQSGEGQKVHRYGGLPSGKLFRMLRTNQVRGQ